MVTRFDELESDIPPSLGDMGAMRGRRGRLNPVDPSVDTFRQRFAPFSSDPIGDQIEEQMRMPPARIAPPGTRERFGDPTKVLAGPVPQNDTPERPPLSSYAERPPLSSYAEPNKLQRFLKNVTPEGPISGVIGLARTAGEAAQGARPDLMTNPEGAIPEAVQGALVGPGARAVGRPIEPAARAMVRPEPAPVPPPTPPPPRQLTYQPQDTGAERLAGARLEAKRVAQTMRDEGRMPPESSGAPIDLPGPVTPPEPPSPLLPPQLVREFGAVRKGVTLSDRLRAENTPESLPPEPSPSPLLPPQTVREFGALRKGVELRDRLLAEQQEPPAPSLLPPQTVKEFGAVRKGIELRDRMIEQTQKPPPEPPPSNLLPPQLTREFSAVRKGVELRDRLNPSSSQNLSAREKAVEAAIRPHLREIDTVSKRTLAPMAALEAAIPSLSEAVSTPGRAASVANWVRVYERAARAKFSDQAKASLGLATKNLNNNLGTDINLTDILP